MLPIPDTPTLTARQLRQLLPVGGEAVAETPGTLKQTKLIPRRRAAPAACEACRRRKIKCSAERPRCRVCAEKDITCKYDTDATETHNQALKRKFSELQAARSAHEQIFEVLRSRPQLEAEEVFSRIRRGADPESILRHLDFADVLVQMALKPEANFRYAFPLVSEMPANLLPAENPYLTSVIYESTVNLGPLPARLTWGDSEERASPTGSDESQSAQGASPYLMPFHAAEVVDGRLDRVQLSLWTGISTDDDLMKTLLRVYFRQGYDWFCTFQKDYFLDDLIAGPEGRHEHCSSLLVNTILAFACHCYPRMENRAEFWNPQNLEYQFLAEARRLWDLELGKARLTTVQAGPILNLIYSLNGHGKVGAVFTAEAVEMAKAMNLFDSASFVQLKHKKQRNARLLTGWALYWYESFNAYHQFRAPDLDGPPDALLPEPAADPLFYGELLLRYPESDKVFQTHFGDLFKVKAEFGYAMNNIARLVFQNKQEGKNGLSVEVVIRCYLGLNKWFERLPESLSARRIVFPSQLKQHMHYHNLIVNIVLPLVAPETSSPTATAEFEKATGKSPEDVLNKAQIGLETVVRLYYLRHGFEGTDPFMMHFLLTLAFASANQISKSLESSPGSSPGSQAEVKSEAKSETASIKTLQSTLILATKGLAEQRQNCDISHTLLRIVMEAMRPEDSNLLRQFVVISDPTKDEKQVERARQTRSQWPVKLSSIADDPEKVRLGKIIREMSDMAINKSDSDEGGEDEAEEEEEEEEEEAAEAEDND